MKLDMVVRESVASYIVRLLCSRSSLPLAGLLSLVTVTEMCQSTTADERLFLKAPTAVVRDRFGWDVALDGNVAVSTTFADQNGQPGATYLMDALDGSLIHKVSASDGNSNDYFGFAAAIDGNTLVVGDPVDPFLAAKPGSIYIYNATTGVQQPKVFATDSTAGDEFGFDVSVSGNRILVGAPQRGNRPGAAYVVDASNPSSQVKLTPSGAFSGDDFGYSVAIDGNLAAVGSSVNYKIIGEMTGGSLYLFDATTGAELHRLKPSDTAVNDEFGWSVALDGELAIVGAPHQGVGKGVAYLFNTTTGAQLNRITAPVSVDGDDFGYAVDMQNGLAVIGAPAGDGVPSHVYVYDT
ncbi:MAG: hypothetical protein KDA99_10715, partial [Planctomycetales bacterium]|nr:hypothetical protein [Planctomycetales bacterium]